MWKLLDYYYLSYSSADTLKVGILCTGRSETELLLETTCKFLEEGDGHE